MHRTTQSALLVAGAAAGVAALAWVGKRRYLAAATPNTARDQDTLPSQEDEQTAVRRRPQPSQLDRGSDDFLAILSEDLIEADREDLPIGRSADPAIDDELWSTGRQGDTSGAALFSEPEPNRPVSHDTSLDQIWDAAPRFDEIERTKGYEALTPESLGSVWPERATQTTHEERPYTSAPADLAEAEDEDEDPNDVQNDDMDLDDQRGHRP